MPKFLCLQRSLPQATAKTETGGQPPSEAEMQKMYAKFAAWQAKFAENLTDPGGRLGGGTLVSDQDVQRSPDGPLIEVKELVGGYMIVSADSLEEAIRVASACPGLVRPGSGVEVIEIVTA